MKHFLVILLFLTFPFIKAQSNWFSTYSDSIQLTRDANKLIKEVAQKVYDSNSEISIDGNIALKNTTPYLIFIKDSQVNLPLWQEVISPQKMFFTEISGSEEEGKKVFGLFFNGYFLVHELGHSLAQNQGKIYKNAYDSEYDANQFAIIYWRESEYKNQLEQCYTYAKSILNHLKNPVPKNEDFKKYVTEHYDELSSDPYQYGYIQFSQIIEIYENRELPNLKTYLTNYKKEVDANP